jgi:hypothetical protein
MIKKSRRRFILSAGALGLLSVIDRKSLYSNFSNDQMSHIHFLTSYISEKWKEVEIETAVKYLSSINIDNSSTILVIKARVEADFKNNQVFIIDGLMLSKTEVALLISSEFQS